MERRRYWQAPVLILLAAAFFLAFLGRKEDLKKLSFRYDIGKKKGSADWCSIPGTAPKKHDGLLPSGHFDDEKILIQQIERLSAAVNVSTESYDDNGDVDNDPRWVTFESLHEVLQHSFPFVNKYLEINHVNKYGLVYTWKGSDSSLKPIMYTAHQDVVPASSPSRWTYPPYQATYDGQFLWGRGSCDCKNNLIGLLSTVEDLLVQKWKPKRTVILAFGFDEETGGERGAAHIAKYLEKRWGENGLTMIVDEGGSGIETIGTTAYALPGVAEKGFVDIIFRIETDGGHSSRPPRHTAIGMLAEMVIELEDHPFTPLLSEENPFRGLLKCQVRNSRQEVESWLEDALLHDRSGEDIASRLVESRGDSVRYLMQTSQAVDIINGGGKDNALPESVTALVNYRVAVHQSVQEIQQSVARIVEPIARKHDLGLTGFGFDEAAKSSGLLTLTVKDPLEPSPISPTSIHDQIWKLFGATIRQVFESTSHLKGKTVVPVGDIMTGNTDTIHYWNLTKNIYRFSPRREGTGLNAHTVDERLDMDAHIEGMRFYYDLMRNFDGLDGA